MRVCFKQLTENELDIADQLLLAAYGFTGSRKSLIQQYLSFQPDGWWIALVDKQPVGYGGAIDYGPFSSIGMLSIHPTMQRRGIGRALMNHIIAWLTNRHCLTIMLESKAHLVPLYKQLGFIEDEPTVTMQCDEVVPIPLVGEKSEILERKNIRALAEYDKRYFGANRLKVLQSQVDLFPERTLVTYNSGKITGYAIVESKSIGPWVASSVQSAEQLLLSALSLPLDGPVRLTLPSANIEGIDLLTRYGFSKQISNVHMYRGSFVAKHKRNMIYAQASPAIG